ncbi:hypothetical protein DFH08DRAFT_977016 [Mycena albidolilacea]|uniref:Uncharacterized protein n=1 Tax=Mycena albidolilacea TaxID=1033008 RepID=A0AAD7E955_9AGAR|nr:hypothetical protein DFH08DRAFT_977016 [Mycena albidolilacea]
MYPTTAVPDLQKGERIVEAMFNALTGHYTSDSNKPVEEDDDKMPPLVPDGDNGPSDSLSNGWHPVYMTFNCYYPPHAGIQSQRWRGSGERMGMAQSTTIQSQ